ncbi:hypothetical protein I5776_16445 [Heyndrickxia vini]|uniref:Uncharacterized protein n=2 Tax=Heyndrickxia vini TaxID=1476025 RepID=A0ABX7E8C6_9BACI|nr:hypothetical protein I5776_16445 [Heyndrickxia vini]
MMLTLSSLEEIQAAKESLGKLQTTYPSLFDKLVHVVNLTRAFQFKYHYMGCIVMDEDPSYYSPNFVQGSVIRLYKKEVQLLKDDENFHIVEQIFADYKRIGYAKISLLIQGSSPESLMGAPVIQ